MPFGIKTVRWSRPRVIGYAVLAAASLLTETLRKSNPRQNLAAFLGLEPESGTFWTVVVLGLAFCVVAGYGAVVYIQRQRRKESETLLVPWPLEGCEQFERMSPSGYIVGTIDVRDTVLYLRPFSEDDVSSESREGQGLFRYHKYLHSEEERLATVVSPVGRLVAIGRPGEPLPELGAIRAYVDHDRWRDVVLHMLRRARLVVLLVGGKTPGFIWELSQSARLVPPERLVLLFRMKRAEYEEFRAQVRDVFPQGLPEFVAGPLDWFRKTDAFSGLVYFDTDWTPRFVRSPLWVMWGAYRGRLAATFRPVVERQRALTPAA